MPETPLLSCLTAVTRVTHLQKDDKSKKGKGEGEKQLNMAKFDFMLK